MTKAGKAGRKRRSYHHGDLRMALIEQSIDLVREHGAAGFSLREAARRLGVDPASCYRHFRDREDLLLAVALQGFAKLAALTAESSARRNPRARILAIGRTYLTFAFRETAQFRVMFGESGLHARHPSLRLPTVERSAYEQVEDALTLWAAAEKRPIDVPKLAYFMWASVHGIARLTVDGAVPLSETEALDRFEGLADAILRGTKE